MRAVSWLCLWCFVVLLGACVSFEKAAPDATLDLPDTTSSLSLGDLRIGPWDRVAIKAFGVDEISGTFEVDPEGNVRMPLLGPVQVLGYTSFELARKLEAQLAEKYLQNPLVTVSIEASDAERFTVDGAVADPGLYPVQGKMTLLQAVALAGGPIGGANVQKVAIFRTIDGKKMGAAFNLELIRQGKADDPQVFGNDIIVVDGSDVREAYGELLRSIPLIGFFLAL